MPNPWDVTFNKQTTTSLPKSTKNPWDVGYSFTADPEYSALRSGTVDFVESAIGLGDELDATIRVLYGEAADYSSAIAQSRAELDAFERENPTASKFLDVTGLGAGLFIPGASLVKIAQTGSKLDRAMKVATLGAVEGAAYGYLSGRDEGRMEGAALGAGLGAGLGAAASVLTRNADDIAAAAKQAESQKIGSGGHIGGEEGFANVGRAGTPTGVSDTSLQERTVTDILIGEGVKDTTSKASRIFGNILLGTKEWTQKNVGSRAARLIEDSEIMVRHELSAIDSVFDEVFGTAAKVFENNPALKQALLRINTKIPEDKRLTWDQAMAVAKTQEEKNAVQLMKDQVKALRDKDFVKFPDEDYMPTIAVSSDKKLMGTDDYANPVDALKQYAKDIAAARAVARRFNVEDKINLSYKKLNQNSRMDAVFKVIDKATKKELGDARNAKAIRSNLQDALRSTLITSKMGGDAVGAISRRAVSTALLANPMNAILNIVEGVTAPVFQNGITAWAQTVPRALVETFPIVSKISGVDPNKWVSNKQLGLDKNFYGEMANTIKNEAIKTSEVFNYIKAPQLVGKGVDILGQLAYRVSGVEKVNRMGQEILSNTAIQRAINLAKEGNLDKLRKHDGMRGLSESEFNSTVSALQNMKKGGSLNDNELAYVLNFAGAAMNKWQPVSASTMPRMFNDNPNARMMYSMLSYMNRQMNNIRTEIGLNMMKVADKGINTKEGAEAAKTAMIQTGKYVALFGVLAGVWDDARKTLDLTKNKEIADVLTPEGITSSTMNQIASNISSGAVNIRAEEFGGKPVSISPPPITAASRIASGLFTSAERGIAGEEDALVPLSRAAQTYAPGLANIDRIIRMSPVLQEQLGRERLLTDD